MFRLVKAKQYDDPTFPHDFKELGLAKMKSICVLPLITDR